MIAQTTVNKQKVIEVAQAIAHQHAGQDATIARLRRGVCLLLNGKVEGETVRSQSNGRRYQVRKELVGYSCNCTDYVANGAARSDYQEKTCKHIWAMILAYLAEVPTETNERHERETALPAYVDNRQSLEDYL